MFTIQKEEMRFCGYDSSYVPYTKADFNPRVRVTLTKGEEITSKDASPYVAVLLRP
jgi:hypothetical protein